MSTHCGQRRWARECGHVDAFKHNTPVWLAVPVQQDHRAYILRAIYCSRSALVLLAMMLEIRSFWMRPSLCACMMTAIATECEMSRIRLTSGNTCTHGEKRAAAGGRGGSGLAFSPESRQPNATQAGAGAGAGAGATHPALGDLVVREAVREGDGGGVDHEVADDLAVGYRRSQPCTGQSQGGHQSRLPF